MSLSETELGGIWARNLLQDFLAENYMCLANLYLDREPLPGIVAFPPTFGLQDAVSFRARKTVGNSKAVAARNDADVRCTVGIWRSAASQWQVSVSEREYCRVLNGRVRIFDQVGRSWEFGTGSAFLLLRGFKGNLQVMDAVQIAYTIFALADHDALDWCVADTECTALGRIQIEVAHA